MQHCNKRFVAPLLAATSEKRKTKNYCRLETVQFFSPQELPSLALRLVCGVADSTLPCLHLWPICLLASSCHRLILSTGHFFLQEQTDFDKMCRKSEHPSCPSLSSSHVCKSKISKSHNFGSQILDWKLFLKKMDGSMIVMHGGKIVFRNVIWIFQLWACFSHILYRTLANNVWKLNFHFADMLFWVSGIRKKI